MPEVDLSLLKDLGGWAVVLATVVWMRNLIEKLIASSDSNMKAAIAEFREFRLQEERQHRTLEEGQEEILSSIRSLR